MKTHDYLALMRKVLDITDYRISKDYNINQSLVSRYKLGRDTLSERHAFIFGKELGIEPHIIIAETKLENAKNKGNQDDIEFWQEQLQYWAGKSYDLPNGQKVTQVDGQFILCKVIQKYNPHRETLH